MLGLKLIHINKLEPVRWPRLTVGELREASLLGINSEFVKLLVPIYSLLSGVPDYFDRNKISSGGDLSHYSSASLY